MIKVAVFGAGGRMGATVCQAVQDAPDLELVAAVDPLHAGIDLSQLGIAGSRLSISKSCDAILDAGTDAVVDFTVTAAAHENLKWCAANGVHAVVGTTGFSDSELARYAEMFEASDANAVIAPNFTIGAVLMMRFAELAAPYFDTAEIIELHHDKKADAPSGTAMMTARRIAAASKDWAPEPTEKVVADGARGGSVDGIPVHSVRMRGMFAHQEVLLGVAGQTLTIRHDSFERSAYMPGVLLALRQVGKRPGLTVGLDALLDL